MKSYGVPLPSEPNTTEYEPSAPNPPLVMLTPSTTYWFSRPLEPSTDGLATPTAPPVLTPGARYSVSLKRRPTGRLASVALSRLAPIVVVVVSTVGDAATTSRRSLIVPTSILNDTSDVWPRRTCTADRSAGANSSSWA